MVWFVDHWEKLTLKNETIKVKDSADVNLIVRDSHHGPVCSDVMNDFVDVTTDPVAVSWTFLKFPTNLFDICYQLNHSKNIEDTRSAVSCISAPGLNFIYGDAKGNIAFWGAGKLVKRPPHVNSALLLDGSSGKDEWLGWYDFKDNPHSENPPEGFVCSANNQPDTIDGILYPGYYTPNDRSLRIRAALSENKKFDVDDMRVLNTDVASASEPGVATTLINVIGDKIKNKSPEHKRALEILTAWNGDHQLNDVGPTIYYKLIYTILFNAMADEMGEKDFKKFLSTHVLNNTIPSLMKNDTSVWWDDILTKINIETRKEIFEISFDQCIKELKEQLGKNPDNWKWGRVHILEHVHPIGTKKPFNKFFNVGPFPLPGGNETINQQGFIMNREGVYNIKFGPALRRVIDFADPENGESILPTGESGNFMSKHYSDQAELFIKNATRKEMMNRSEIEKKCKDKLTLQPLGD